MGTTHLSGLEVAGVPTMGTSNIPLTAGGKYVFVNSSNGSNGNTGLTADQPLATIDYAIGLCSANKGDTIIVGQGHAETVATAGAIACDVAGVNIIGLGTGSDRPELTFNGVVGASVLVTAANVQIANIVGICGLDLLTNPFHIQAAGCTLGNLTNGPIEWQDAGATQAIRQVLTTTAADDIRINLKVQGSTTGGTAPVNAIRLVGCIGGIINLDFYGRASTAIVEFITTVCANIEVYGYVYNSGTVDGSKNVVDTVTGSTWFASLDDGAAGASQSGGSGSGGLSFDELSGIERSIVKSDGNVLNGADNLFIVAGGPIMITQFVGRVTTLIVGASNMTVGEAVTTPSGTVAFSTTVAIDDDAVGTTYTFTAAAPGVLTPTTAGALSNVPAFKWLAVPGTIIGTGTAARAGVIEWTMSYIPMSPLASVTVAA